MHLGSRLRAVALAFVIPFFIVACGGGGGGGSVSVLPSTSYTAKPGIKGGQLVYSDWEAVNNLFGFSSSAATISQATTMLWLSLWTFDPTNVPVPDLASEIPATDNGGIKVIDTTHMDMTVNLKAGLKWSDGSPLTSDDVIFTWQAICDPAAGYPSTAGYDHIVSIEKKSDTQTVWHFGPEATKSAKDSKGADTYRCGMTAPLDSGIYAPYLLLGIQVYPKVALGNLAHGDWAKADYFNVKPTVTSGPYMVESFTPGNAAQVVMVPNPHYADGRSGAKVFNHAPYLDKVIYKIYGTKPSQIAGLAAGDSDLGLDLIANDLPALQAINGYTTVAITGLLDEFLTFNQGKNMKGCPAPYDQTKCGTATIFSGDKLLRQAVNLAIDKNAINDNLVHKAGVPMNGPLLSTFKPWADTTLAKFTRDVAKANSLLDQDGWVKGSDGIRAKAGRKLHFTITTTAGNKQRASEVELIANNLKEIGADVPSSPDTGTNVFDSFNTGGIFATGQYDVALFANNWQPDPDSFASYVAVNQIPSPTNQSGGNWGHANDPALDALFAQGANVLDIPKRIDLYNKAQAEWLDNAPTVQLYERPDVFSFNTTNFGNFSGSANSALAIWNMADWFNVRGKS
ncbi:MAG TPA: peptide ABC transporter substrate-binding protein [Candidatus Dormibacteraeota bacterium]